jgi:hypothetical protein
MDMRRGLPMRIVYWTLGILGVLTLMTWVRVSQFGAGLFLAVVLFALGFGVGHVVGVERETERFLRPTGMSTDEWQGMKIKDARERDPRWVKERETIARAIDAARKTRESEREPR